MSEQLGGEAIKALEIFNHYKAIHPNTIQITHARNRTEVNESLKLTDIYFVEDDWLTRFFWKSVILRGYINSRFSKQAVQLANQLAKERGAKKAIIHQTGPNSPVIRRAISALHFNVFGPINGNIYRPDAFAGKETGFDVFRRFFHTPLQRFNAIFSCALSRSDQIFVAGGQRTKDSLLTAGCDNRLFVDTDDCGVSDALLDRPIVSHQSENYQFVHIGRLVKFKCTDLLIKALANTQHPITLDIIGNGPELLACQRLVDRLHLQSRVRFLDWSAHGEIGDILSQYRGLVLPSVGDSNGVVVQEAMAVGLPVICLDWGGPQLLVDDQVNGVLIQPKSEAYVIEQLASHLDALATRPEMADRLAKAARHKAGRWRWSVLAQKWLDHYEVLF